MRAEKDRPQVDVEPISEEYPGITDDWAMEMMRREIAAHLEAIWDRLEKLEGNNERNGQE